MALDFKTPGKLGIGSVIAGRSSPASSMSYHASGKRLFVAVEGDSRLQVIDCLAGKADRPALKLERESIRLVRATHHEDCVLCTKSPSSGNSKSANINYLSVYDNKILRTFPGHADEVTCISQSPENDTFLSSSNDGTVRLWTLQSAGCLAQCPLPADAVARPPLAVFDSTGLVFGIAAQMANLQGHYLHLYDARNHSAGAFSELVIAHADWSAAIRQAAPQYSSQAPVPPERAAGLAQQPWTSMQFNASGDSILIGSGLGVSTLLDGFEGTIQKVLLSNRAHSPAVSCFTADDKYVLTGNDEGTIDCWQVDTGALIRRLNTTGGGSGNTPVEQLAFNPCYTQFACAASKDVALWIWNQ